jgi:hypothetical protein
MSQHGFCHPDIATKAGDVFSKLNEFKGRMFSEKDWTVLQKILEAATRADCEIKVYDVSRVIDGLRALFRGVRRTPAVIINGEKREGTLESMDILMNNLCAR